MPCVYHGRTKGEGCGHVKSIKAPSKGFTDRSKAMLLLWFTISVIISLCMYVLLIFLFIFNSVWPLVWDRNGPFGILFVVF